MFVGAVGDDDDGGDDRAHDHVIVCRRDVE